MLLIFVWTIYSLVSSVLASWDGNLNYRSPSINDDHDGLGINLRKVHKRMLTKRDGSTPYNAGLQNRLNFTHGVASGDPYDTSVILWTRISPQYENDRSNVTVEGTVPLFSHETEQYVRASSSQICVDWLVSSRADMSGNAAASGRAYTTSDIDYTIKIEATKLHPFITYYYQFTVCDSTTRSPIGRTKTSPTADSSQPISFAVFSCSNYPNVYFNAYGNAARKDNFDYAIHLGDYIYETRRGDLSVDSRAANPERDTHAFITVWDDHEIANNNYRDGSQAMNNTEQSFNRFGLVSFDTRKMNAVRAYFEWMPLRQADLDDNLRIWRSFQLGKNVDLIMLDTRSYDRSITSLGWNNEYENWFYNNLVQSKQRGATWRVIGNQIIFSRINRTSTLREGDPYIPFGVDSWDGYTGNRNRTYKHLYDNAIGNNIMLAGDSHQNWVSDMIWLGEEDYDPATGAGSIGVEFAGTAVSSSGPGTNLSSTDVGSQRIVRDNQELQWQEGYYRGYYTLHISASTVDARFYGCPSVATRNPYEISLANFTVRSGENHLARPVAGGVVANGAIKTGSVQRTNLTLNTQTGTWGYEAGNYNQMYILYPPT